jgi:hypothetical protein
MLWELSSNWSRVGQYFSSLEIGVFGEPLYVALTSLNQAYSKVWFQCCCIWKSLRFECFIAITCWMLDSLVLAFCPETLSVSDLLRENHAFCTYVHECEYALGKWCGIILGRNMTQVYSCRCHDIWNVVCECSERERERERERAREREREWWGVVVVHFNRLKYKINLNKQKFSSYFIEKNVSSLQRLNA